MRIREIRYWGGRGHDAALAATMLKRMPETRPKVRYGVYRISRVPSGRCCGTSPRLMEYGKDTGWTVSSIPEANCILGGEFRVGLWSAESPPKRPTFSISHPFLFMAASIR